MPESMIQLTTFVPLKVRAMKLIGDPFAVKYGGGTEVDQAAVDVLRSLQCVLYRESWGRVASDGLFLCEFMTPLDVANTAEQSIIKDFVGRLVFDPSRLGVVYKSLAVVDRAAGKPGWRVASAKAPTTPDALKRLTDVKEEHGDTLRWVEWNREVKIAQVDAAHTRRGVE